MKHIFVTGTDTSVGKTVVSRALLQYLSQAGLRVIGYKPVARGSQSTAEGLRNKDALMLQASSSVTVPYHAINPVALEDEETGVSAAEPLDYGRLSLGLQQLREQCDRVIVEGTGGWRTLMNDMRPLSSWVIQEQLPVIMVVGIKTGCINHALLTAQAVLDDGLPLLGWVANRINPGLAHYAEIMAILRSKIAAPMVGELPYLPRAEQRDLTRYIDLSPLDSAEIG